MANRTNNLSKRDIARETTFLKRRGFYSRGQPSKTTSTTTFIPSSEESVISTPTLTLDEQANELAMDWINRKASGKRIIRFAYNSNEKELYRRANKLYEKYLQNPQIAQAVEEGSASRARSMGLSLYDKNQIQSITRSSGGKWIPTGKYVTDNKKLVEEVKSNLPVGDKVIYNPVTYEITGIQSAKLGQSIPFTNKGIDYYNQKLSNVLQQPAFSKDTLKQMSRDVAAGKTSQKVGKITSFFIKGDAILNNYKTKLINNLESNGIRVSKVGKVFDKAVKDTKKQLDKIGLGSKDFNYYNEWMKKRRNQLLEDNDRISLSNREFIAGLNDQIKSGEKINTRGQTKETQKKMLYLWKNIGEILAYKAATTLIDMGFATPILLSQLKKNPLATLASLPPAMWEGVKQDYKTLRTGDGISIAELAVEYYTIGKAFEFLGKAVKKTTNVVDDLVRGKRIVNGKIVLRKSSSEVFKVKGVPKYLVERVKKPSLFRPWKSIDDFLRGRKPGQFRKFTTDPGLVLKESTVKSAGLPLSQQVKFAGTEVTAVNAAADQLTSWIRRKKIIRKPISGEENAPIRIRQLITKFDNGKRLTFKEFVEVNVWLQKNVAPNITLLERSLYLDPSSGVRFSRLGIKPENTAKLIDVIRGNFKFKSNKPQILVFEKAKVANFPKRLDDIKRKLLTGKPLTQTETQRLLYWQVQSGQLFKPIGSTIYAGGIELEVTLAPGELIKRIKSLGHIRYKGKKVSIVQAEVFRPPKSLAKKIKLANLGKLSEKEVILLEKRMSKLLGRKIKIETPRLRARRRNINPNVPVLRITPLGLRVLSFTRKSFKRISPRKSKLRTTPRRTIKRVPRPKRVTPRRTKPRVPRPKRPTPRKLNRRGTRPKRVTPRRTKPRVPRPKRPTPRRIQINKLIRLNNFKKTKLRKAEQGYYVVIKVRGKKRNLNPRPLTLKDAKDYLAYKVDNGLSRTAWFEQVGRTKNVVRPPKSIQGYFSKNSRKLRPYKIRVGKKKLLRNGYIEKSKYIADTKGERSQLSRLQKRVKRRTPKRIVKRRVVRRKTIRRTIPRRRIVRRKRRK